MKTATFWSSRGGTKKKVAEVVIENDSPVTMVPRGMFAGTNTFTGTAVSFTAMLYGLDAKFPPNDKIKPKPQPQPLSRGRILDIE